MHLIEMTGFLVNGWNEVNLFQSSDDYYNTTLGDLLKVKVNIKHE